MRMLVFIGDNKAVACWTKTKTCWLWRKSVHAKENIKILEDVTNSLWFARICLWPCSLQHLCNPRHASCNLQLVLCAAARDLWQVAALCALPVETTTHNLASNTHTAARIQRYLLVACKGGRPALGRCGVIYVEHLWHNFYFWLCFLFLCPSLRDLCLLLSCVLW